MKPDNLFKKFGPPPMGRPPSVAVDRMGRSIEPGHILLVNDPCGVVFEVVDVRPVMIPGQEGMVQLRLQAEMPLLMRAGVRTNAVAVLGETKARRDALAEQNGEKAQGPTLVLTDPEKVEAEPTEN